jgi:hypothetical protein
MKGMGTFRRMMSIAAGLVGLGGAPGPASSPVRLPSNPGEGGHEERAKEKARRGRSRGKLVRHTHNLKRVGWPLVHWGDCPKALSKKQLKRIASEHPLLHRS